MGTHTPGPWKVETERLEESDETVVWSLVNDLNGIFICGGPAETSGSDASAQADANARLIAAAPDLLSALKECEMIMRGARTMLAKFIPDVRLEVHDAVAAQAVAAIAKATGKTV